MAETAYKRILLKLSGESFKGDGQFGIEQTVLDYLAEEIRSVHGLGVQIALVLGGGNIVRGEQYAGRDMGRESIDYAGMLATIINGIFIHNVLSKHGMQVRVQSVIHVPAVSEEFVPRRAIRHMEKERVVLFAGGTGLPLMSTDTASALRAIEIKADIMLMAKYKVDGVYSADPNKEPDAEKYGTISYRELGAKGLKVMDRTAASLCMDNKMDALVFDIFTPGNLRRAVLGEKIGTLISN